jgi:Gly-Xaa carboxypeptidase
MPSEKVLLLATEDALVRPGKRRARAARAFLVLILLIFLSTHISYSQWRRNPSLNMDRYAPSSVCEQVDPLLPRNISKPIDDIFDYQRTEKFRNESIARLSGAVQIPSMSFDDLGTIGEDPRWDIFYKFAAYLEETFPLIHQNLDLEVVNTHGLLYTWIGSNTSLKPTLLMAHQDVVPVPESTLSAWTHPPFSGFYDGKFIWGRGSADCKNTLIASMESIELLLQAGFTPRRTVILSFGFDEEVSGRQGAQKLSAYLLDKLGQDSVAVIVDEGASISSIWGSVFATPGTAEKGYVDVDIIVRMPGGHSSIPPAHSGIGVISQLIALIEDHPYEPYLADENPFLGLMQCGATYGPEFPHKLKKLLPNSSDKSRNAKKKKDKLAHEASKAGPAIKYLMTTSVAVDVISGGVKVNALPERTVATVNHRINVGEDTYKVKHKLTKLTKAIAARYNLTVHAFNDEGETPMSITLTARKTELPPAPVTPTSISSLSAYSILSGTTRALYGTMVNMSPGIMTGNTDTRYYWSLTKNIFRFSPGWDPESEGFGNIHTVDEKVSVHGHIRSVQWYTLFLRNMDEAELP